MRYYRYVPEVHICIHKCTRPMLFLHNRTTALHKCTPTGSLVPSVTRYCRKSRKTVQLAPLVIEPLNRITTLLNPTYGSLRQSRTLSRGFICCPRGRYVYVNTGYGYVETTLVWYTSVYIYVLGYISVVPDTTTTPSAILTTIWERYDRGVPA